MIECNLTFAISVIDSHLTVIVRYKCTRNIGNKIQ